MINQLDEICKVCSDSIKPCYNHVGDKIESVNKAFVNYTHINRCRNYEADEISNEAINYEQDSRYE